MDSDDPSVYRKPEEVEQWEKKDPILRLRRYLEKKGIWNSEQENQFKEKMMKEVDEAIDQDFFLLTLPISPVGHFC